jgi:hypothetical protein
MLKRKEAVLRGLRFIYQNSLEGDNFEDWGGDYLWCFHCVASTSADPELRAVAREMGTSLALKWQGEQQTLPELADADEVGYYMSMIDVSSRLGIENHALREHVGRGSRRFTARDYLGFDPVREAPPGGARSRYDIWCDALVLTYTGDGCGIPMGASYVDVLRWLRQMRPYRATGREFRDTVLAITHLVYTLNDYNRYRLSPEWLPQEFEFLRENLKGPVAAGDAELLGEFVDCLRALDCRRAMQWFAREWTICWPARMRTAAGEMSMSPTSTSGITLHGPQSTGFGSTHGASGRIGRRGCERYCLGRRPNGRRDAILTSGGEDFKPAGLSFRVRFASPGLPRGNVWNRHFVA